MLQPIAIAGLALSLSVETADTLAILSVADPPGPGSDLGELTRELRAACRGRAAGVLEEPELRSRLAGQTSSATLPELERAHAGALAAYQRGQYEGSIRTLRAILDDLDKLPESADAYEQWIRALLLLAHAEATLGHAAQVRAAMERVVAVEPQYHPDPDQYSPTYRREFEAARARVAARPRHMLTVTSVGAPARVYVDGRASGTTPVTLVLPAGRYRIGGVAGTVRVPSAWVDLRGEDRSMVLDLSLAEALRASAGPGLALAGPARASGIVRAGAWLGVDRVLAASILAADEVQFLAGSLYDVRRGALVREGRVRMTAGSVPSQHLSALATFLLTGQHSDVVETSLPQPAPAADAAAAGAGPASGPAGIGLEAPRAATATAGSESTPSTRLGIRARPWMRPAAYAAGAAAVLLAGFATYQGISAHGSYQDAHGLLRPDGTLAPGAEWAQYSAKMESGDSATRRAYLAAGGAVLMAAMAGVLWYVSGEPRPPAPAVRF